jgi:molecular chaperone GrpE
MSQEKEHENEPTPPQEESPGSEAQESASQENGGETDWETKCQEAEDRYLRAYAEFENIKRRLEKEKYQAIDYASEQFAKDLLPVADALDLALQIDDPEQFEKLKEGLTLTRDNLIKAFEKHGVGAVAHEEGFDPNCHEAIMQVESEDHEENDIVQILQPGYRYKERILRPSLVSVCKK